MDINILLCIWLLISYCLNFVMYFYFDSLIKKKEEELATIKNKLVEKDYDLKDIKKLIKKRDSNVNR